MFSTLLPPEGAKTVWEDRCILVHLDNAKDVSGAAKLVPSVLLADELPADLQPQRAAVYPPDAAGDSGEDGGGGRASLLERLASHLQAAVSPLTLGGPLTYLWSNFLSGCQPRAAAPPLEWHPRKPWLAAADARGRVQGLDLGQRAEGGGAAAAEGRGPGGPPLGGRPEVLSAGPGSLKWVLGHEALHHQALSLAWCPASPGLLAVGSAGVVGLWALAGEARPPLAAAGRAPGPWLRLLKTRVQGARVTSLSWSPDGQLLAAASPNQAGLQVWQVHSGIPTTVSAGPAAFDTVRWSPCGNYVFAAGTGSLYFYIFETQRWRWARWQTADGSSGSLGAGTGASGPPPGGPAASASASVVAAVWAPPAPGRNPILLAALSGQSYLIAVHLVDTPPGLTAQLLPVTLPELQMRPSRGGAGAGRSDAHGGPSASSAASGAAGPPGSRLPGDGGGGGAAGPMGPPSVVDMAWEPRGERLAVLLTPAQPQDSQCVAVYGTTTDPLVSARLIGMARPAQRLCVAAGAAVQGRGATRSAGAGQPDSVAGAAGTADGPAPSLSAAQLSALPGSLTAARLWASGGGATAAGSPCVVVSARVGELGVYNLPCYF